MRRRDRVPGGSEARRGGKFEARSSKLETNSNGRKSKKRLARREANRFSAFARFLSACFELRASSFELPALALAWLLSLTASLAGPAALVATAPESGIQIELQAAYQSWPVAGFLPCSVRITNDDTRPHSWTMMTRVDDFRSHAPTSSFRFSVEARSRRDFQILVPVSPPANPEVSDYRTFTAQVQGFGVVGAPARLGQEPGKRFPKSSKFMLMGARLAVENWGPLEEHLKSEKTTLRGSRIELAALPAEALALLGVETIWLARAEWQSLRTEQRHALEGWVRAGGRLMLCDDAPPQDSLAREALGLGEIEEVRTERGRIPPGVFLGESERHSSSWPQAAVLPVARGMSWIGDLAEKEHNNRLLMATVLLFGLLVGPVNLFVLARGRRRHWIFLTTPVLCLGTSAIGAAAIFLQDGLGGEGRRAALIQVMEDRHEVRIEQEQVAQTGLMLQRGFEIADHAYLSTLRHYADAEAGKTSLHMAGTHYSGDWFRSRWRQAHLIEAVRPSRAGLALKKVEGALEALSSYEGTLDTIFVRDAAGQLWHGHGLQPGRPLRLAATDQATFDAWRRELASPGPVTRERLSTAVLERNLWIASGPGAPGDFVETHPAIRWREQRVILFGEANP